MNFDRIQTGDKIHAHFSFANTDTVGNGEIIIACVIGQFAEVKDADFIFLSDGYYILTYENGEAEKTNFDKFKVPIRFDPIFLCDRIMLENISSLVML